MTRGLSCGTGNPPSSFLRSRAVTEEPQLLEKTAIDSGAAAVRGMRIWITNVINGVPEDDLWGCPLASTRAHTYVHIHWHTHMCTYTHMYTHVKYLILTI